MSPSTRQHTPGPWRYAPNTYLRSKHVSYWEIAANEPVATVFPHLLAAEANARLIAAAPDLLNLLTAADRLEELTGENLAVYARTFAALARAAIARATGGNAS